jgi:biotin carboxylase
VVEYSASLQFNDLNPNKEEALNNAIDEIKALPFPIIAVIPGAETGVELADMLSDRMGLRSNGSEGSIARRNKYHMGEKVRQAGVRAVKQKLCRSLEEIQTFLCTLPGGGGPGAMKGVPLKCVVKPVLSAGSDDVFLCNNKEDAIIAFSKINGELY